MSIRTSPNHTGTLSTGTLPSHSSRRAVLGLALGAALGAALGGGATGLVAAARPKAKPPGRGKAPSRRRRRKPRYRTVTRIFSNATPITVSNAVAGPATPYPSAISVAGLKHGLLLDVNVTLNGFSHPYPSDLDILLESPDLRRAVILSDVGSSVDVSNLTLTLDDQAGASLPANTPLTSGTFKPTNADTADAFPPPAAPSSNVALATFNGINPNGAWRLYVVDAAGGNVGTIAGWSLTIRARVRR